MQMAATIAGGDDAYAAKRLREISRALDELRTHLAVEGPVATRSNK